MARLTQKQTLLAIVAVTVTLCGAAAGGVYWASDLIEIERLAIESKEKAVSAARKKINKIPGVENKVIVLRENVANYVKILPQEAELTKFARDSQKFAVLSGISIDRFVPVRGGAKGGAFRRVTYQYYFQATVWQFMKFMNFFESHKRFARVRDFKLTSGASKSGEDAIHDFRITVETYVYNPSTTGTETHIANYPAKVEALRHEIAAAGSLDVQDPYEFRGREGRRDIFIDPRQSDPGDTGTPLIDQRQMLEECGKLITDLQAKWEHSLSDEVSMVERIELQRAVSTGLKSFETRTGQITENQLISSPSLTALWYKEVQTPYKNLLANVQSDEVGSGGCLPRAGFVALVGSMQAKLKAGDLESVVAQYSQVESRLGVAKSSKLYNLRLRIEGLATQAKIALEFSAIPLAISGVIVQQKRKSGVILNNVVYEEGEYINENLFVKRVRDDEVQFVYKGFTLVKTW